jgi:hypothetical protein
MQSLHFSRKPQFISSMKKLFFAIGICMLNVAAFAQTASAAPTTLEWSLAEKKGAIAGCRASIIDKTTIDYMTRHNLNADQLPDKFRERMVPSIEPLLATCDCMLEIVSKEYPLQAFSSNLPVIKQRVDQLLAPGGVCAPKVPAVGSR